MCVCKENHSFYKNNKTCLPNDVLENGPYIIKMIEPKSGIPIYDDYTGIHCDSLKEIYNNKTIWFSLGEYKLYSQTIQINFFLNCILIFHSNNSLFFVTNKNLCISHFVNKICENKIENDNLTKFREELKNAKEYNAQDTDLKIFDKKDNTSFYLVSPNIKTKNGKQ